MSSTYAALFERLDECLDELAAIDPVYRTVGEKQEGLVGWSRVIARAGAERLRVLAAADDVAESTGDRSTATWLATATRDAHGTIRRDGALAVALDQRWTRTADAFASGSVNLAQVRVIVEALDALPAEIGEDLREKAEALLVQEAAVLGPRDLRVVGARVLERLAPEVADEAEYQRLLAAEHRAGAETRLTIRPRGDGSSDIHARVPDHTAGRLSAYLNAFTAPRRQPDDVSVLPLARQRGIAFQALLENIPAASLPRHGGTATSVMVTLDHHTLVRDLDAAGLATTSTGHRVTAGVARRLACQAGILPAVLGSDSQVLDLGRTARLFSPGQRKALNLRDRGCTETGCTMPAEFCEAHHQVPWSRGGKTDLREGTLLCPFHHHRAHDPAWLTHHHPNGTTTFTRRQ
jgi:hypothetical protein